MQRTSVNRRGWLLLAFLLLVFLISSYFLFSKAPKHYSAYDSQSPSPTGIKAIYSYLEGEINTVGRWTKQPSLLSKNQDNQLLIMVEPSFIPDSDEMQDYIEYMEAGNTILLLKSNPEIFFDIKTTFAEETDSEEAILFGKNGSKYYAKLFSPIRLQTDENDVILLNDHLGVIALKRTYGNGSLIVSNSPNWMMNELILEDDHIPLLLSLIQENHPRLETVLFDEYNHGNSEAAAIINVYPKWFILVLFQGFLLAVLFLWFNGKRFGPILIPREESVRFGDESLRALAAWHLKGNCYRDSFAIQAEYLKLLLQERWGIPFSKAWGDCAPLIHRKWKEKKSEEMDAFLRELTIILNKDYLSKQEYMLWSKKLDRLRKEVEEG